MTVWGRYHISQQKKKRLGQADTGRGGKYYKGGGGEKEPKTKGSVFF